MFVVTGAAGSIVAAITADLARPRAATFHLLDLAPRPEAGDPDVARLATDRDGLKLEIAGRLRAARRADAEARRARTGAHRASAAALAAIEAIERAGGTAHWHAVDLTDPARCRPRSPMSSAPTC